MKKKFLSVFNFYRSHPGKMLAIVKRSINNLNEKLVGGAETILTRKSPGEREAPFPQSSACENLHIIVLNSKSDLEKFAYETLSSILDEFY